MLSLTEIYGCNIPSLLFLPPQPPCRVPPYETTNKEDSVFVFLQYFSLSLSNHGVAYTTSQLRGSSEQSSCSLFPFFADSCRERREMATPAVNGVFVGAVIMVLVFIRAAAWNDGSQLTMVLERGIPTRAPVEVLRARDHFRHRRILQGAAPPSYDVVDFPVERLWNPFTVGLYFTRVKLGNPAKEFYVQIDTGSDILWVTCNPCSGCPTGSGLNIKLESCEPDQSSTSLTLSCSD